MPHTTTIVATVVGLLMGIAMAQPNECDATDVWIFSGQSNMQKIGGEAQRAVGEVVESHGREYQPIYVAAPGKPIEAWLDSKHKDYRLWQSLQQQIAEAKAAGHRFQGFVWYQGESNVGSGAGKYQRQLTELVARVRKETGQPRLPVIVVQLAAATSYDGKDWAVATIREAQRRFARDDDNAAVVAAIDAEIGDYTVHLGNEGAKVVASRVAAAADRLAYSNADARWGPQFQRVYFADKQQRAVIVEFSDVAGELKLGEGWLAGFGASVKSKLPKELSELDNTESLGELRNDFIYPIGGTAVGDNRLALFFEESLSEDALLSYAAARNAQYGPHRRWGLEFGGLTDGSGHHAPAFVLVPIDAANRIVAIKSAEAASKIAESWEQIAVNCIGRYPAAITTRDAEAGIADGHWRQSHWNPASSGLVPNLYDREGRVTGVHFRTGVWYMSPYFREIENADDALMASWCKNKTHSFSGLQANEEYDMAVYLLQGPPKKNDSDFDTPPDYRAVRVQVLHVPAGKKPKDASIVSERTIQVPARGDFERYQFAGEANGFRGNVLVMENIPADKRGEFTFVVEVGQQKNGRLRWGETTLAGVQLRKVE